MHKNKKEAMLMLRVVSCRQISSGVIPSLSWSIGIVSLRPSSDASLNSWASCLKLITLDKIVGEQVQESFELREDIEAELMCTLRVEFVQVLAWIGQ